MSQILNRKRILLSDSPDLLLAVRESILQTSQVAPLITSHGNEVMALVRLWKPDLILLESNEIVEICQTLKNSKEFRNIPIIAIIENNKGDLREGVLSAGCDDWLATPLMEMELLNKIQDLIGLRFRKLPRYSHNAPALVSFKGKDFPSKSIDINRRMIFLESDEGLAPATGRNVLLKFQLTKKEPVRCWGRVIRLMARKGRDEEKEIIGMLIRFLDLPPSTAKRIDSLALQQTKKTGQGEDGESSKEFDWLEVDDYEELAQKLSNDEECDFLDNVVLPEAVLKAYLSGLSEKEKDSFKKDGDSLLRRTIATRIKLMDDLTKWKRGGSRHLLEETLEGMGPMEAAIQGEQKKAIEDNLQEDILLWAKIKSELLRTKVEISALGKGYSRFARAMEEAESRSTAHILDPKMIALGILLLISLIFNFVLFQLVG